MTILFEITKHRTGPSLLVAQGFKFGGRGRLDLPMISVVTNNESAPSVLLQYPVSVLSVLPGGVIKEPLFEGISIHLRGSSAW
jgi:hypothetical protein